jgi:hypothetical protein
MQRRFEYEGGEFAVDFFEGVTKIENNETLWAYVNADPPRTTRALVDWMQSVYKELFGKPLQISDNSFIMEIWGHIYFEHFLLRHEGFGKILFPFGLYKRLVASCEAVDCGESHIDNNRWLWDLLGVLTPVLGKLIPKNSLD